VNYISYDGVTLGKFIGASADDLPDVTLSAKSSVPIGYAGNKYSYSLDELRKSQQLRIPLDSSKAKLAFRGAQEHTQRVAYFGDAARGMTGLFNNPQPGAVELHPGLVQRCHHRYQIVADLNQILVDVYINSATVHVPTRSSSMLPASRSSRTSGWAPSPERRCWNTSAPTTSTPR
jgi:hypothetical protein